MRIALSVDNKNGLDSVVSAHFGRCPHFVLVDLEEREVTDVTEIDNPFHGMHRPGGVPRFIHEQGVGVMLTGGMGRRAIGFFAEHGVEAVTGASGTVRVSLARYLGGQLKGAAPCAVSESHRQLDLPTEGAYEKDELGRLKEEAEMLQRQLDETVARLDRLRNQK